MKKTIVILLIMLLILVSGSQVFAQTQAGVIFLLISPSVQANSMGGTYANTVSSDPMASVMNPAYLGFFAQQNTFGYSDSKADWLPALVDDITYQCKSFTGGYTLKNAPVTIGFGYHQIKMDYGSQYLTFESGPQIIGPFNSWDEAKIYSYSALLDYYVRLSIGMNFKSIESHLIPEDWANGIEAASAHAMDWGLALQVPVLQSLSKILHREFIDDVSPVTPVADLGLSYGHSNIGDKIWYIDPDQADPLPRNAQAGVNLHLGLKYQSENLNCQIISWQYAWESEGLLVERNPNYEIKYPSTLWSVDSDKITHKTGWELSMFDFLYLRNGHYKDKQGQVEYDTYGWGVNFIQFYRMILWFDGRLTGDSVFDKMLDHLNIEYHRSEWRGGLECLRDRTEFDGVTVRFTNIF